MGFAVFAAVAALAVIAVAGWVWFMSTVETPDYRIVKADGAIELRDYPKLVVAEVKRQGERQSAVRAGFGPLAGYIFAKERPGEKISITAPVTQALEPSADKTWTVRFIMPSKYDLTTLPAPAGSDVTLAEIPAQRRLAIRFSGLATDDLIGEYEARLRSWAADNAISVTGKPTYAYYNDPFTPGFLRRNEVLFDVAG